jgi:DNA invertase Pin-like site-specific DNA recombinase
MVNVIELIRVSTEGQAGSDRASIPAQRTVNQTTAARYDLNILHTIELTDVSGASVLLAPEIQRLIELIQSSDIGGVVTREFSRLMRPEKFSDYALLQAFADSRTKLYLPDGPIDFSEKSGRLMGTIRAAIAGLERSEIQERCWRGKEEKRKAGKLASGSCAIPIGVGYDKQRGFFYTDDAQRVLRAYEMVLSGQTMYREISRRTGLSGGELYKLLHNPIWKGWRIYEWKCDPTKRHVRADGRQGWSEKVRRSPEEVIRVQVIKEPLISEKQWADACRILDVKREAHRRERGHGHSLYSGFLICDLCGSPMIPITKWGQGTRYYLCRSRKSPMKYGPACEHKYVRADRLETVIDNLLSREVTSPAFIRRLAERMETNRNDDRLVAKIDRLEIELRSAKTKRDRVVESFIDGVISRQARDERLKVIDSRVSAVTAELVRARQTQSPVLTVEQIAQAFQPFAEWDLLGREDRRRILAVTIPRIRVHNLSITGFYRLLDGCEVHLPKIGPPQPLTGRINSSFSRVVPQCLVTTDRTDISLHYFGELISFCDSCSTLMRSLEVPWGVR